MFVEQDAHFDLEYDDPASVPRRCTDSLCCIVFLIFLAAFGFVGVWGFLHGDLRRLHGFPDTNGNFCGVTEIVKDLPFLYFCKDQEGHLSHLNSLCVDECPNPPDDITLGADSPRNRTSHAAARHCPTGTYPDYHTRPLAGFLCVPKDSTELQMLVREWESPTVEWLLDAGEVLYAWEPLLIVAVGALVLGLLYLVMLEHAARCIVWSSLFLLVAVLLAAGAYLIAAPFGYALEVLPTSQDNVIDLILGAGACILAFLIMCVACCLYDSLTGALRDIEEACNCVNDRRSLILLPCLALLFRLAMLGGLGWVFLHLASCMFEEDFDQSLSRPRGFGVLDKYADYVESYDSKEVVFMVFFGLFSIYLLEIAHSIEQFVVSYITQEWFFARNAGAACSICSAFGSCLFYHLGTMALGSLAIALFRFPREVVHAQVYEESSPPVRRSRSAVYTGISEDHGHVVARACSCACSCCISCYEGILRYMTKAAFMDVAINSNNFCNAAAHSVLLLQSVAEQVRAAHAASHMFQLLGAGSIGAACAVAAHVMVSEWPQFADKSSDRFVTNPLFLDGTAAVIGIVLAWPFVQILSQVASTILFCYAIEEARRPPTPVEPARPMRSYWNCCSAQKRPEPGRYANGYNQRQPGYGGGGIAPMGYTGVRSVERHAGL